VLPSTAKGRNMINLQVSGCPASDAVPTCKSATPLVAREYFVANVSGDVT